MIICTHVGPLCPPNTHPPHCPPPPTPLCLTVVGPPCPPHTIQGPACPVLTAGGPQCPQVSGFNCPSVAGCQSIACVSAACQPGGGGQQQAFARQAGGAVQTLATVCTQIVAQCPTYPNGDCTFFGCHTQSGPGCPPTPATICTQFAPCPTHHIPCVSPGIDCTVMFCTHAGPGCPTPATVCTELAPCPTLLTQPVLQCNPSVIDACPTRLCTHQFIQCHPSAVDACPTRLCTQFQPQCQGQAGLPITWVNCPTISPSAGCYTLPPRCNTSFVNCNFA